MKQEAIILDLDGTLCNTDHRIHHLNKTPKDWDSWNAGIMDDEINFQVKCAVYGLLQLLHTHPKKLLIVTGRFEEFRTATESWLTRNGIVTYQLFMRKKYDFRSDTSVKEEIYHRFIEQDYDVKVVLEDRGKVVQMWRSLGLECWQVKEGDY